MSEPRDADKRTPDDIVQELRLGLMDIGPMWTAVAEAYKGAVTQLMMQGFDQDQACFIVCKTQGWIPPQGWREDNVE